MTVLGEPIPQGSTKAFARVIHGKPIANVVSDNPRLKGWRSVVAYTVAQALREPQNYGLFFNDAVSLTVTFYLPRPKALQTKAKAARDFAHVKKPDLDKLVRATKDALTGVVWRDDAQVTDLLATKRYCAEGDPTRAVIVVSDRD